MIAYVLACALAASSPPAAPAEQLTPGFGTYVVLPLASLAGGVVVGAMTGVATYQLVTDNFLAATGIGIGGGVVAFAALLGGGLFLLVPPTFPQWSVPAAVGASTAGGVIGASLGMTIIAAYFVARYAGTGDDTAFGSAAPLIALPIGLAIAGVLSGNAVVLHVAGEEE